MRKESHPHPQPHPRPQGPDRRPPGAPRPRPEGRPQPHARPAHAAPAPRPRRRRSGARRGGRPPLRAHFNVHFRAAPNNLHVTFTDPRGRVRFWASTGTAGFKGPKRSNTFAAQGAGRLLLKDILAFRSSRTIRRSWRPLEPHHNPVVNFHVRTAPNWLVRAAFKVLFHGLRVSRAYYLHRIFFLPPVAHNGLRARKPRRV